MSALEPPDTHYLSAAIGWLELGNPAEAKTELARMTQPSRRNPDVLEVEWAIHAGQNDWSAGLLAAQTLMQVDPKRASGWLHHAYALRRVAGGGSGVGGICRRAVGGQCAWNGVPASGRVIRAAIGLGVRGGG